MIVKADKFESFEQVVNSLASRDWVRLFAKYPEWRDDQDVRGNAHVCGVYLWLREVKGHEHRAAAMLACRAAPKANTDREYLEGRHNWAADVGAKGNDVMPLIKQANANAKAMGLPPIPDTAVYEPGLAQMPLDPRAFLTGGRNELRRKCEANNLDCDGPVKVRAHRGPQETKAGKLGTDLVNEIAASRIRDNPDLARGSRRELVASIRQDHEYNDSRLTESKTLPAGFKPLRRKKRKK